MMQPPRRLGAIAVMLAALAPMMMPRRREELLVPGPDLPPEHRNALVRAEVATGIAVTAPILRDLGFKPPPVAARPVERREVRATQYGQVGNINGLPQHCTRCRRSQFGKCRAHRDAALRTAVA